MMIIINNNNTPVLDDYKYSLKKVFYNMTEIIK